MSSLIEIFLTSLPDWPEWAIKLLMAMSGALIIIYVFSLYFTPEDEAVTETEVDGKQNSANGDNSKTNELHKEFDVFRRRYLIVYLIIMLADWMQGTHMYTLYLSYDVNISALFLTGFLSGAIFAPFMGSAVDKFGRKKSCIVYCILEIIINILEHIHDFRILLLGRILGGISTNLLFSAFESWMTTQHRHNGFPESWLQRTYAEASIGNGTMAVLAGIVAQLLEDSLGQIGPFQGAVALTALAMIFIFQWEENYGETDEGESSSLYQQFAEGWKATISNSKILRIGLTQAMSEGAMYTFVFMWVPTMLDIDPPGGVPTGCVFSSLMIAITMGGILYPVLHAFVSKGVSSKESSLEVTAALIYFLASLSMTVPAYCLSAVENESCFEKVLISFVIVEICVGLFNPVAGTLRSKYVPDGLQGGILNIFRLPLNGVVVAGTYATDYLPSYQVFAIISACFLIAALLQVSMISGSSKISNTKKNL